MPAAWQHVKAGKLKAIAVTSARRSVAAPEVPTIAESGLPDYVVDSWYGALAPAKTPSAAVARLNAAFVKVLENPQVKERLLAQGAEAASSTPAEFDRLIKDELAKWDVVIKTAKIRPD
jgi:tripartite-type tricarboxylate transporter receptor subunit TctC